MPTPEPTPRTPAPSPPPPDPCAGEGWDDVEALARSDGDVLAVFAAVTRPDGSLSTSLAGSERFHLRVLATPGGQPPVVYVDLDGRGQGAWSYGSSVSAATWNLRVDEEGVHRHVGPSDAWTWEPLDVDAHHRWSGADGELLACVPSDLLGAGHRVAIGVQVGDDWLPRPLLPGAPFPPIPDDGGTPLRIPDRLAIAYGYRPWVVRGCTEPRPETMACASAVYGAFRHVVLAGGLEEPEHPSHAGTRRLVERLRTDHPGQELWGYVSLRRHGAREHTVEDIAARAAAWQAVGVTGIFLDEADLCRPHDDTCTGEGVTRASQAAAVATIHDLGMPVFANGFSAPDVLEPIDGLPSALGAGTPDRAADMYLLENPTLAEGEWPTGLAADASVARIQAALRAAVVRGIRVAVVDTAAGWVEDDSSQPGYVAGWWRAVQAGAEAYGFTNPSYSAPDDLGANLAILEPPVQADAFDGLTFASTTLRLNDRGRRVSRDVVDCEGRDVGALVTRVTGAEGALTAGLVLREDRPPCP